jgi:hypothetical protein
MRHTLHKTAVLFFTILNFSLILNACSDDNNDGKGIGPIKKVELGIINEERAIKGRVLFSKKCMECHRIDVKLVGPALKDVTKRRKSEWIMNMILNTEEMINKDPEAKKLFEQHIVKMVVKDVNKEDARDILEYLRSVDNNVIPDTAKIQN